MGRRMTIWCLYWAQGEAHIIEVWYWPTGVKYVNFSYLVGPWTPVLLPWQTRVQGCWPFVRSSLMWMVLCSSDCFFVARFNWWLLCLFIHPYLLLLIYGNNVILWCTILLLTDFWYAFGSLSLCWGITFFSLKKLLWSLIFPICFLFVMNSIWLVLDFKCRPEMLSSNPLFSLSIQLYTCTFSQYGACELFRKGEWKGYIKGAGVNCRPSYGRRHGYWYWRSVLFDHAFSIIWAMSQNLQSFSEWAFRVSTFA